MIAGQLEIQLMANIARLQEDMNKAQSTVDRAMGGIRRSADMAVKALAALGVGLSAAALTGFIRGAIDAADEMSKLSQKIGVGVESVAGLQLAFRQSGISAGTLQSSMSRLSREIAAGNDAFNAMGISVRSSDGALKSSRQVLGELADKFAAYEDGVAKTALAMNIFGKSGAELIPLLNGGSAALDEFDSMASKLGLTLSEETAKRAERFNDTLDLMGQGMHGIGRQIAAEMLPTFNALADQFFTTLTEGDRLKSISDSLSTALRGLTAAGIGVVGAFQAAGNAIGGVSAMIVRVFEGDFASARVIAGQLRDDLSGGFRSTIDSMTKAWTAQGSAAFESMAKVNKQLRDQAPLIEQSNDGLEKRAGSIKKQAGEADKLAKIEERRLEQLMAEGARLTESIDPLVKRNNEIQRYKTLLESGAISEGIYSQAVERSTEDYLKALGFVEREIESIDTSTKKLESTSVQVFDSMEQIAIQGVRNIQSSFADGIFNFFDNGLKGMVSSVVTAVGRIASEFASIKLLQAAGGLFGLGGASTAFASGGGGLGTGLSLASLGSSAVNLFKTGLGATGLIGGGLSALGGSSALGMFGAGMQGGSAGAAFIAAESATGAGAAGLGASMGAVAGPLIALAVVDQIGRFLAGNKSTGTFVDKIPVIGGFASALFGRGPLKQGMTVLRGDIGTGGFESGGISTRFDAKGGLFRSNKTDFAGVDALTGQITTDSKELQKYADSIAEASRQIIASINNTVTSTADSLYQMADDLGIGTSGLDDFNAQIKIVSEAGKFLSEEKIAEEVARITDEMALSLLPSLNELGKEGESAFSTLQRLSSEFAVLKNSATILGLSLAESSELIGNMSFESRTAFIDAAGGVDALGQKVSFFAQNFLTTEEQLAPVMESVTGKLSELGLSAITTRDQFKDAIQSYGQVGGITESTLIALLDLAPAFAMVADAVTETTDSIIDNSAELLRIAGERESLETRLLRLQGNTQELRNRELNATDESNRVILRMIFALEDQAEANRNAANAVELSTKAAEEQRRTLESNLKEAFANLSKAVNLEKDRVKKSFDEMMAGINDSIKSASSSIGNLKSISEALTDTVTQMQGISRSDARGQINRAIAQSAIGVEIDADSLRGALSVLGTSDTSGFSTREAFAMSQAKDAALLNRLNDSVMEQLTTEEMTLETLETQRDMMAAQYEFEIDALNKIVDRAQGQIDAINGVDQTLNTLLGAKSGFVRALSSLASSVGQMVNEILDASGFASGGMHSGGLRWVGERGPELELTGPSRIVSNDDMRRMLRPADSGTVVVSDDSGMAAQMNRLLQISTEIAVSTRKTTDLLLRVTRDGESLVTTTE